MSQKKFAELIAAHPPRSLGIKAPGDAPLAGRINKAGILLFIPAQTIENWRFSVMRPVPKHSKLAPPPFQLPKGTRMHLSQGIWRDIVEGELVQEPEPLAITALREAEEEIGLKCENVAALWEVGPVTFTSATSGAPKWMWLFAGELISHEDFLEAEKVANTTLARASYTLSELELFARPDHTALIRHITEKLLPHYLKTA